MCVILLKVSFISRVSFFLRFFCAVAIVHVCVRLNKGVAQPLFYFHIPAMHSAHAKCVVGCVCCVHGHFFSLHVNKRSSAATLYLFMQRNYVSDEQVPMMRLLIKMYNFITCGRISSFFPWGEFVEGSFRLEKYMFE